MQLIRDYWMSILQGLLLGMITILVILTAQALFSKTGLLSKKVNEVQFHTAVQAAFSYQKRNFDFIGVCEDTAFPDQIRCVENGNAFKLEAPKKEGGYFCADSTGFNDVISVPSGNTLTCY